MSISRYHSLHFWDLRARRHVQTIDLGANHQMALELRPAHDPTREYGFLGVVVDTTNLEGSVWTWWRNSAGKFEVKKTAVIPAEPADAALLPPLLKGFNVGEQGGLALDSEFYVDFGAVANARAGPARRAQHPCAQALPCARASTPAGTRRLS